MKNAVFVLMGCLVSAVSIAYAAGPAPVVPSHEPSSGSGANGRSIDAAIHPDLLNRQREEALAMIARHAKEREAASLAAQRKDTSGPQAVSLKHQQPAR